MGEEIPMMLYRYRHVILVTDTSSFVTGMRNKKNCPSQQHGKGLLRYPVGKIIMEKCEEGREETKESHPKTRRKKGAAKLYAPGELNELIDRLCHRLTIDRRKIHKVQPA
jgi:hypothetical protein